MSDWMDTAGPWHRSTWVPACVAGYDCSPGDCDCKPSGRQAERGAGLDRRTNTAARPLSVCPCGRKHQWKAAGRKPVCLCDPDTAFERALLRADIRAGNAEAAEAQLARVKRLESCACDPDTDAVCDRNCP